jgi:hypothetical protein
VLRERVLNICVFAVLFALVREARRTTLTWSVIAFLLNRSEPVAVNYVGRTVFL